MKSRKRPAPVPATPAFKAGDDVEVTSGEDGLVGAWFSARVLRAAPRAARYTVVYDRLLDDADPSSPLKEQVDALNVRPRPPRFAATGKFTLFQPVDAFQNDAWWSGVVVGVHDGGRFRVKFAVEECEYGVNDLRAHVDWNGREWVVPEPREILLTPPLPLTQVPEPQVPESRVVLSPVPMSQRMPIMEFTKGIRVEVSSDEEGFRGAWFTATIIESVGEKFLIEYENLRTDDETELLRETIDPLYIRPTPPATPANENFKFLDEVDALYNDGWWVGVISKVLDSPKYAVYFKTSQEEMEFNHQELRLHYDWVDGTWLQASKAFTVEI